MPRPVYIICSESGSDDLRTGLASFFNIIEKIQVARHPAQLSPKGSFPLPVTPFRVTAVWMEEKDDKPSQEYEYEMRLVLPPAIVVTPLEGKFTFEAGRILYRMSIIGALPAFAESGMFVAESRIRKVGELTWKSQDFPIPVEILTPPKKDEKD